MQIKQKNYVSDDYLGQLKNINNINFTAREIDILACLLNARGTSRIASFLSLAPKTVVNHIRNVMLKLGCNSREGIIDFIEKSHKQSLLRIYYSKLILEAAFKDSLIAISKWAHKIPSYTLIYWKEEDNSQELLEKLKNYFSTAGVKILFEARDMPSSIADLMNEAIDGNERIYFIPEGIIDEKSVPLSKRTITEINKLSPKTLFIHLEKEKNNDAPNSLQGIDCIIFAKHSNYYSVVFDILKKLLPHSNFESIIEEFKKQYEVTENFPAIENFQQVCDVPQEVFSLSLRKNILGTLALLAVLLSVMGVVAMTFFTFSGEKEPRLADVSEKELKPFISNLIIPSEATLLNRPELITQIGNKFKEQKGIQSIAIVGIGGAGKTTLARHYAHQQNANIIWEINAETNTSLIDSFEELAQTLAKTDHDQKIFRELQEIKNSSEREERIIDFVKDHLRIQKPWLLIYDNVENFPNIQKYFPQGTKTWGEGRAILTTRNHNIQNSRQVNGILLIGELSPDEKFSLFMQIIGHGEKRTLTAHQKEETVEFLKKIPPFPLDVSVAADYLKTTNVPYTQYVERLNQQDKNFIDVQEKIRKEAGEYTKTRYSIINLSLEKLIAFNKEFADLLLFISLLDSQNIPRDLLEKYKNPTVVDSFIYHLKKFSMIRDDSLYSTHTIPTFSIHRSTQEISLKYLINVLTLEKNTLAIKYIIQTLEDYINETVENQDYLAMKILLNHCLMFLNHQNLLNETSKGIIEGALGRLYLLDNNPKKAKIFLERGLASLSTFSTDKPSRIAECLVSLGLVFYNLGDFEKTKDLTEKAINIYKKNNSQHNPAFAKALRVLGSTVSVLGDYRKAKNLLEQSLVFYRKNYPENHIRIAEVLSLLGFSYYTLGYYEKSKTILEQSITTSHKDNARIGEALIVLGLIYMKQGNYGKTKDILEKSLIFLLHRYPKDHFVVMWAIRCLGSAYQGLGNYKEAKKLLEESVVAYEKHFGKNHTETSEFVLGLGELYLAKGNFEMAEALIKRSLNIFRENKHSLSYASLESLAELYLRKSLLEKNKMAIQQSQSLKAQAIDFLKQALEIVKTHFPADSPHITRIQGKIKEVAEH